MDETKLAHLDHEKLEEIGKLEDQLGVILIAYDNKATPDNESSPS